MAKNELVPAENFQVAVLDADFFEAAKEEMEGLGPLQLDRLKVPSGGGIVFELPGDDADNPELVKELTGVIVGRSVNNSYWQGAFTGQGGMPDCLSTDGKTGVNTHTGERIECETCPHNQYGTAVDSNGRRTGGKACKNTMQVYIMLEGAMLPVILSVPATSLKNLKEYLQRTLLMRNHKYPHQVVTKITLKKMQSNGGSVYSQCVFSKAYDLTAEQVKSVEPARAFVKQLISAPPAIHIEAAAEPAPEEKKQEAFGTEAVYEEVPF